ncbi:MAG: TetR/AcrR family transcriptional regulator [Rhodococcus sp.]|nr:TetR/AcrR family transcriptional regulator [Rhodococcus sp. (in: high G+C Gram-positive bacteria)]
MTTGPGRPRLTSPRRPGSSASEQILDAAAELFTTVGFTATSTRKIADAVGIRQASLYHHFGTKEEILEVLLERTVSPALAAAESLTAAELPVAVALHALSWYDASQLASSRWNLGALYLLPELSSPSLAPFVAQRQTLRGYYSDLAVRALHEEVSGADTDTPDPILVDLPFRIVESAIATRADDGNDIDAEPAEYGLTLADAGLRALGIDPTPVAEPSRRAVEALDDATSLAPFRPSGSGDTGTQ